MDKRLLCIPLAVLLCVAAFSPAITAESPWRGRTVVVTGANRGIGLELARQLHAAGANVIGTARRPAEASELRALGVRVEQLDVTDPASVAALAERLEGVPVDILLNNAGIYPSRRGIADADPTR